MRHDVCVLIHCIECVSSQNASVHVHVVYMYAQPVTRAMCTTRYALRWWRQLGCVARRGQRQVIERVDVLAAQDVVRASGLKVRRVCIVGT